MSKPTDAEIAAARARLDRVTEPLELNTAHPAWKGVRKLPAWPALILAAIIGIAVSLARH